MFDPYFKRLMYLRYAEDFIVLIIGSINETKMIKHRIADTLHKKCGLNLNQDKTIISGTKDGFQFLGAFCIKPNALKAGLFTNSKGNPTKHRMRMRIEIPVKNLFKKLVTNKFAKNNERGTPIATARRDLVNFTH